MKKLFLLISFFLLFFGVQTSLAFDVPERPKSFVNDYANVLSITDKTSLENKISNFEKETSNEIAVVITQTLDGDTIENVAQNIFTKWGIGKKDKNNGVLLLVSMTEHKTRIHTGYGVEGSLTDIGTSYIQTDILTPAFKKADYFGGINGAVDKMILALGGSDIVPADYNNTKSSKFPIGLVFFFLFIIFQIVSYRARKHKKIFGVFPWWWWFGGGGFGGGSGGSSGGFGGFGGGMSGGGGSSSSW